MKLFYVVTVACMVLITGCVLNKTQSELRKTFNTQYNSVNSSKVIAPCVANEWKKLATFLQEVQLRPTINGHSVWTEMVSGGVVFLVDIDDLKGGSTASLYIDPYLTNNPYGDVSAWRTTLSKCLRDNYINCRDDSDCRDGFSCRTSRNGGGGTECRAYDIQQPSTGQAKAVELNTQSTPSPITEPSEQPILNNSAFDEYDEVKITKSGGVYLIPVLINDVLQIDFIIDSGASEVLISRDVVSILLKKGTIKKRDRLPGKHYQLADGSITQSDRFIIRTLKIGNRILKNVTCSISNSLDAPLLLGQSALEQLGNFTIHYETGTVRFNK